MNSPGAIYWLFLFVMLLAKSFAFAGPGVTTYQAKIIKPDGYPLEANNVNFKFTILNPSGTCILYAETYSAVNMANSGGVISFSLGTGVKVYPSSATTFTEIFSNINSTLSCDTGGPVSYSPGANDVRKIVMQFHDGSGWQTLPAMSINAVPYAMYATEAQKLSGLPTCNVGEALSYNGASFSCETISGTGSVTSATVTAALGYTPANSATVSSTVTSLSNSVAASFAAITSSQWTSSGTNILFNLGRVGIGNVSTPVTALDVSGGVRLGSETSACSAALAGTLRYNSGVVEYCNGTSWSAFGVSGAGILALNGLTSGSQTIAFGIAGTAPNVSSTGTVHTFNFPFASVAATTAGLISNTDYLSFSNKLNATSAAVSAALGYVPASASALANYLGRANNLSDLASSASARTNLGLGSVATYSQGNSSGTVPLLGSAGIVSGSVCLSPDGNTIACNTPVSAFSPWVSSATAIYYLTNNVGIGTSAPTSRLEIKNQTNNARQLMLTSFFGSAQAGEVLSGIDFVSDDSQFTAKTSSARIDAVAARNHVSGTASAHLVFSTANDISTLVTEKMRVTSLGDVGIGTSAPITKLDVAGGLRISMESASCAVSYAGTLRYNSGTLEFCNGTAWSALGVAGAGITNVNGSTSGSQSFANGTAGNSPAFVTANGIHTLNIPLASAGSVAAGLISNADYVTFNNKVTSSAASIAQVLGYTPASASALSSYLVRSNNLSDLASSATARTNLGVGYIGTLSSVDLGTADVSGTLAVARLPAFSGDVTKAAASSTLILANSGVTAGTYQKVTVDAKGRVTSGTPLTTNDVTTALGYTPASASLATQWVTSASTINYMTGNVGIGTVNPVAKLDVQSSDDGLAAINVQNNNSTTSQWPGVWVTNHLGTAPTGFPEFAVTNRNGTSSAPAALTANKTLGQLSFWGRGDTKDVQGATIFSKAQGTFTDTSAPADLIFATTPAGALWPSARVSILSSGTVGIGTSNPVTQLDVSGTFRSSGHVAIGASTTVDRSNVFYPGLVFSAPMVIEESIATTAVSQVTGVVNYIEYNPSAAAGAVGVWGSDTEVIVKSGNAQNIGHLAGGYFSAEHAGSGIVPNIGGVEAYIFVTGSGTTSAATAGDFEITHNGSGLMTAAYGVYSVVSGTGTIGTGYGLYIDRIRGTANYGVYQAYAGNKNYFAGNVGIGTGSPVTKLEVSGAVRISMETAACATSYAGAIRYNSGVVEYCNGTSWASLGVSGSGITSSAASIAQVLGYTPASAPALANYAVRSNNLSDLTSSATARTNLGVGYIGTLSSVDLGTADVSGTLAVARLPAFSGDVTKAAASSTLILTNSGVTAGTYAKVTVDAKGRVTSSSALTTADVTSALGYTPASNTVVSSQWTTSGTSLNYNAGRIGIATTNPDGKLHVIGSGATTGDNYAFHANLKDLSLPFAQSNNVSILGDLDVNYWPGGYGSTVTAIKGLAKCDINSNSTCNGIYGGHFSLQDTSTQANAHLTSGAALFAEVVLSTSAGTVTSVDGISSEIKNVAGAVSLARAIQVYAPNNSATVTTYVGINIEDMNASVSGITNAYPLRYDSATSPIVFTTSGSVGVGTATPRTRLEVSGGIKISMESAACAASYAGTLRYNAGNVEYCNGSTWSAFQSGAGAGLSSFNGSTSATQSFALGTTGTSPGFSTVNGVHTLNIPLASVGTTTAGLISNTDYVNFNSKVSSQWVTSSTSIYYNSGNVGVGTTNPAAKFHVQNDSSYSGAGGGQIRISGATNANIRVELGMNTSTSTGFLQAYTNGGSVQPISLNPDGGNVGIGTATPVYKLSVFEATANVISNLESNGTGSAVYHRIFGKETGAVSRTYFVGMNVSNSNAGYEIYDATSATSRLYISKTGAVGIGTVTPSQTGSSSKLHVTGDNIKVDSLRAFVWDGTFPSQIQGNSGSSSSGYIDLNPGNGGPVLRARGDGKVGVGTTSPANTLTVSGTSNFTGYAGFGVTSPSYALDVATADSFTARLAHASNNQYDGAAIMMVRGRNTTASYTTVSSGDTVGGMYFRAFDGASVNNTTASIEVSAGENQSTSARGNYMIFETTKNGTNARSERMRIANNGFVGIGTTQPNAILQLGPNGSDATAYLSYVGSYLSSSGQAQYAGNWASTGYWGIGPATNSADNNIRIGNIATASGTWSGTQNVNLLIGGNLGLGQTNPLNTIDALKTSGDLTMLFRATAGDSDVAMTLYNDVQSWKIRNAAGYADALVIEDVTGSKVPLAIKKSTGQIGIGGVTNPTYQLDVSGTMQVTGTVQITSGSALRIGAANICTSAGCTSSSDLRLKENIKPLDLSLEKILALKGVQYDWKNKSAYGEQHQIGFIAQDLEKVFPEVVYTDKESGLKSVSYGQLIAPLVEAFKTLYAKVNKLFEQTNHNSRAIASLEEKDSAKDAQIKALTLENQRKDKELREMKERLERIEKALQKK